MAHRFLTVPPHLSGTVPWVELPSGRGCLPLTVVHACQRDAHACCCRSLGRSWHTMPVFSLRYWGRRGWRGDHPRCVRLRPQASSATAATRVVGSPGPLSCYEGSVGLVSHAPGSPMLPVQALCHPPLTSAHRGANGMWVSALAEVPGGAPALRDSRRCRGGGVWRRGRTTAMFEKASL